MGRCRRALLMLCRRGQPLRANIRRRPLNGPPAARSPPCPARPGPRSNEQRMRKASLRTLDRHVLLVVSLNPELRVKVSADPPAVLQQAGYTPVLVKVLNDSTVTKPLASSARSRAGLCGGRPLSMTRQGQLAPEGQAEQAGRQTGSSRSRCSRPADDRRPERPEVEYAIALDLLHGGRASARRRSASTSARGTRTSASAARSRCCSRCGRRSRCSSASRTSTASRPPAGSRSPTRPGTSSRRSRSGSRPDFFFQKQIYRPDGGIVLLPPGRVHDGLRPRAGVPASTPEAR